MKEDHIIAGILMLLIAALVFGALSQATSNGITGGATSLPGISNDTFLVIIGIIVLLASFAATFGFYNLYVSGKLKKGRSHVSNTPSNLMLNPTSMGNVPADVEKPKSDLDKIKSYIAGRKAKGEQEKEIKAKLSAVGWKDELITQAFK